MTTSGNANALGPALALLFLLTGAISAAQTAPAKPHPKRIPRADSFLGIHFDFHAGDDCKEIGKNTTRQMIQTIIDLVHPDYIQIDCKGHPGLSSYPTNVGNQAPGFVGDPLRLWRDVTAENGVSLYMHYSGVWDSQAIRKHPDWAVINADGKPNPNAVSFFSPYADHLLIPQLRELSTVYAVDGAWVDGECWASQPDFSDAAINAFRQATGIQNIPRKPGDPHWFEFLQFNREQFRKYLRHYIAQVKQTNPQMQLCSNWAFTDHMPEPVSAPVDWLSGDYSPQDSVNSARFSARYLARQGKPWDLMAWSFAHRNGQGPWVQKSAVQLQREAAAVLSLGGGFQAYFTQRRDGSVKLEEMPVMAQVAKFCRDRQPVCHHALPVPQVALLYSTASHYRESNGLFPRDLSRIRGTLQALLECQLSVEVLGEHNLAGRMPEYPLIVLPECTYLDPPFKQELVNYVQAGGSLLLVGPQTASLFQPELGNPTQKPSIVQLGRGTIAATLAPFSQNYLSNPTAAARDSLNALARQLFPNPIVQVTGSHDVDVAVNRLGPRLAVNLVNTAGPHATNEGAIVDSIPPVGPLQIAIRLPAKPANVTLEPGGQPITFQYQDGLIRLTLQKLDIHSIILVE